MSSELETANCVVTAVDKLKAASLGRVITSEATSEYGSSQTCWNPAAAYVQPHNTEEVAKILKIVVKSGSKFAVRTRGHTPNPGFSSMRENGIVHVKAGSTWGEDRGVNSMGLEKVSQCWWVFTDEWPQDGDDAAAHQAVSTMSQRAQELARETRLFLEYLSMNFASSSQDVLRSYGVGNIRRLWETAAKYDPDCVFQKLQNDGFSLRKLSSE
ncbi:hypothetical protein F5Y06DRAFT_296839 [Hypoxylon sp. FL0890]|nr:hypothetical protein F5Y06DRAFT_296839 [Hypoxylon sp. FL0890]